MPEKKKKGYSPKKSIPKPDPVYVATGSFVYRFEDGTHLRLREGVVVEMTGAKLKELKRYKHIKEVK